MKIITESTITKTEVEFENSTYTRLETSAGTIQWIDVDVVCVEYRNDQWQERFKCSMRPCAIPTIELAYRELLHT